MNALTWIASGSLAAWLWLLLGQWRFWRTDIRLPERGAAAEPERWPAVAVVVPARDEAGMLPLSLPGLLAQEYPGRAEVVLVDDGSTDGTGAVADRVARELPSPGLPLTVTSPGEPPHGWTGKLWALRHGMELARERTGAEYLLLTDADIAHAPGSLRTLVAAAEGAGLDLLSQMARLRADSRWERLIVPAFVYFFTQLYPFGRVNRPSSRTAAAAGGCVLLRSEAADRAGVPYRIRGAVIDDVTLARAVKRTGGRIWLGLAEGAGDAGDARDAGDAARAGGTGGGVTSVRPYERLPQLWAMVARCAYAQLGNSPFVLLAAVAAITLVYLVPPVAALAGSAAGAAAWAAMALTYVPMLRYYRQPPWRAVALPAVAGLYLLMTVDSALRHHRGRGAAWKGRTYGQPR